MSEVAGEDGPGVCQHELFEAQVARSPDATAVIAQDGSLTYAELDGRADHLARHLRSQGVGPDVLVGVCVERSLHVAVALLGILKAGGACVPLDPAHPAERLAFLIRDAGLAAVLTSSRLVPRLPTTGSHLVLLDPGSNDLLVTPAPPAPVAIRPDNVAYVIYTSGSTGRPKGVLLTHRGLVNHHLAVAELYGLRPEDRVLQFCSLGFDASIEELFPTWAAGATVVFRSDEVPILGPAWLAWLRAERVSVLNLPTAYWHEWTRDLSRLEAVVPEDVRLVIAGGEKARGATLRAWRQVGGDGSRWVNAYGPTEASCMSTSYERPAEPGDPVDVGDPPIGRPLANTVVRVVDGRGDPVAPGAPGELLLGGAGLARGYLNHPELTAERFVADPERPSARLYRTGDLVRLLPSGDLDYLGRLDEQVKIQGSRVECGEVEAAIGRHPAVAEAVVVAREEDAGDRRLVAYVVPAGLDRIDPLELRRYLSDRLPSPMVPSSIVTVAAFPLTPHGKVDRRALPGPKPAEASTAPPRLAPRTDAERRVAAIWAGVLGVDPAGVSVDDDFFDVGGHSLLATQVMARMREEFDTDTPLRALFEAPTVAGLAALVDAAPPEDAPPPPLAARPRRPSAHYPLSLAQEQMWYLELAADPPGLYNVTAMRRFAGPVDEGALRRALADLVDRHETLRTAFAAGSDGPEQVVQATADVELAVSDLSAWPPDEREAELGRRTAEQDRTPFDPSRAPLVRAHLVHLDAGASQLLVTFDHLICDGTSAQIFVAELTHAYEARRRGRSPSLPPLEIQFADFAVWQRQELGEDVLDAQLRWWAEALAGVPLGPAVPFDRVPSTPTRQVSSWPLQVPPETYGLLQHLARATQSSLFTVCTAAVQALLSRCGGLTDIVLSTTVSGRQRAELERLISMFAGVGRVRTDLSGNPSFSDIVRRARVSVLGLFEHQDIPFMRVRRALWPDFPTDPIGVAAALPIELGYFHTSASGAEDLELFFRGQLHPLSVTLGDEGARIRGELSYKVDFYDEETIERLAVGLETLLAAVSRDPSLRLAALPLKP